MVPALTVARSLGRMGHVVVIGSDQERPLAGYSRHVSRTLMYPDPLSDEKGFVAWCEDLLANGNYRLIIPVTERTVVPMQRLLGLPGGDRIAIAPPEALVIALDKDRTMLLASDLGIPTPKTVLVNHVDDIESSLDKLDLPVVIKPMRSIGINDADRKQLKVDYGFDQRQLMTKLEGLLRYGPVLLQEYVNGEGVGIEAIADHGDIVYAFQHTRVHEVPLTGGGSSLRVSEPVNPQLLRAARKLLGALRWHGVAMVEFKWDRNENTFSLMEINGRFWGSLPLAVAAGADFPKMLFELLTMGRVSPAPVAEAGIFCRKLSSDFHWLELVLRREGPPELVSFPSKTEVLRDWLRIFHHRHCFDVQQWRDPLPGIVDLGRIARAQLGRLTRVVNTKRLIAMHGLAWRRGIVGRRLRDAHRVLFVCYGNINRSPLAEHVFQRLVPDRHIIARSAGFHSEEGRRADPVMLKVAASKGVDLSNCASQCLSREMVDESDVVFVMELQHYVRICDEFPGAYGKTYLLSAGSKGKPEIADPYGKTKAAYEACAHQIYSCIEDVANRL